MFKQTHMGTNTPTFVPSSNFLAARDKYKEYSRVNSIHEEVWPTLTDISVSMCEARDEKVVVSI